MANYIYTNGNIVSTDDIKHWKYIKREKKNGKWRYYYSDNEYNKAAKNVASAKKDVDMYDRISEKHNYHFRDYEKQIVSDGKIDDGEKAGIKYFLNTEDKINAERTKAGEKYVKATKALEKLNNKDKFRKAAAKGAIKVANFFSNLFSKKKKKKKK